MTKVTMPGPVAYSVLDKRAGKHWYTHESKFTAQYYANEYSHREPDGTSSMVVQPLITTDQAQAYADARVKEALEEAANVAKRISDKYAYGHYGNEVDTADEIETAIRALIK